MRDHSIRGQLCDKDHPDEVLGSQPRRVAFASWGMPVVVIIMSLFLIRCAPKTMEASLPLATPESFSATGNEALPDKWWTAFGNTTLNGLVDSALATNFTLQSAWHRLRAARAVVDRESGALVPAVDASFNGGVSHTQTAFEESQRFRFELSTAYEVDLWGRIRSRVEAERFRAEATRTDFEATAISLSAEIVTTWLQLMEARSQLQLVQDQITTNTNILRIVRNRFGGGQVRSVDILRQEQLLEATHESATYVESRIAVLEHRIAVLSGVAPQDAGVFDAMAMPDLPPLPSTGVPLDLIQRRPDVQSAFNRVHAADRDLAAAITNKYPRLTLSASVSSASENIGNLFKDWAFAIAGNLLAPVFYGGELRAEVDRAEAFKQEVPYDYGQSVLVAFREVEDALIRENKQRESIARIEAQLVLTQQSYEQLRIEYFNGLSDYLDVLTALTQQQQLQRDLLSSRLILLEYRVDLYRALAGGFEPVGSLQ